MTLPTSVSASMTTMPGPKTATKRRQEEAVCALCRTAMSLTRRVSCTGRYLRMLRKINRPMLRREGLSIGAAVRWIDRWALLPDKRAPWAKDRHARPDAPQHADPSHRAVRADRSVACQALCVRTDGL